jgi:hypothetical protein
MCFASPCLPQRSQSWLQKHEAAAVDPLAYPIGEQAHTGKRGPQLFQERLDFASVARNLLPVLEAVRLFP